MKRRRRSSAGPVLMPSRRNPPNVTRALHRWQDESRSQGEPPAEYSEYHQRLAWERLEQLQRDYRISVAHAFVEYDEYPGMGGMPVVHAEIMTRSGHTMKVQWNRTNRDFMIATPSGGYRAAYDDSWE